MKEVLRSRNSSSSPASLSSKVKQSCQNSASKGASKSKTSTSGSVVKAHNKHSPPKHDQISPKAATVAKSSSFALLRGKSGPRRYRLSCCQEKTRSGDPEISDSSTS